MSKHGTSDMLIWGREFSRRAGEYYMEVPGDPEVYARERILALTEYVSQIHRWTPPFVKRSFDDGEKVGLQP
jgi:hypothetical protein